MGLEQITLVRGSNPLRPTLYAGVKDTVTSTCGGVLIVEREIMCLSSGLSGQICVSVLCLRDTPFTPLESLQSPTAILTPDIREQLTIITWSQARILHGSYFSKEPFETPVERLLESFRFKNKGKLDDLGLEFEPNTLKFGDKRFESGF